MKVSFACDSVGKNRNSRIPDKSDKLDMAVGKTPPPTCTMYDLPEIKPVCGGP